MELQSLFMAIYLVAIYASVTGVVAGAVFCVLRLLKKRPSFFGVFIWCAIALFLMSTLSANIAMLMAIKREGHGGSEEAVEAPLNSREAAKR